MIARPRNDAAERGLVRVESSWGRGRLAGVFGSLVLASNLVMVIGTASIDGCRPVEAAKPIGHELEVDQARRAEANLWDGSLARLYEDDVAARSRVRKLVSWYYSRFLLETLDEAKGGIVIGPRGWMFDAGRLSFQAEEPERAARRAAAVLRAIERRFASHGTRVVAVLVPRKGTVVPGELPFGFHAHRELDAALADAAAATGMETVDLGETFWSWRGEKLFRIADTHWSTDGMRLAGETIARATGLLAAVDERRGKLAAGREQTRVVSADLLRRLDLELPPDDLRNRDVGTVQILGLGRLPLAKERPLLSDDPSRWTLVGTSFSTSGFDRFLGHYLGAELHLAAFGGVATHLGLSRWLEGVAEHAATDGVAPVFPEVLFLELPVHQSLKLGESESQWSFPRGALTSLRVVAPAVSTVVETARPITHAKLVLGEPRRIKPSAVVVDLPVGSVGHSGDGALELALDVEVVEGKGKLIFTSGDLRDSLELGPGRHRLVLPILRDRGRDARAMAALVDRGGLVAAVHDVQLIACAEELDGPAVRIAEPMATRSGLEQVLDLGEERVVHPHDALLVERGAAGGPAKVVVQLEWRGAPVGEPWTFAEMRPGAPLVLSLGALSGRAYDRVRVETRGQAAAGGQVEGLRLLGIAPVR